MSHSQVNSFCSFNRVWRGLIWSLIIALPVISVASALGQEEPPAEAEGPEAFVLQLTDDALTAVGESGSDNREINALVQRNIPIDTLGQLVLGQNADMLSDQQKEQFDAAFADYLTGLYANRMRSTLVEEVSVESVESVSDTDSMVATQVIQDNGPAVNVDWRVRETEDGYQLLDMVIEGVSLLVTKREEFGSLLSQDNGFDKLLETLRSGASADSG